MCTAACPFGAIGFDEERQQVFKCDLCDGKPLCVDYCFPQTLDFLEDYQMPNPRLRKSAARLIPGRLIR
jgi:Fe-S-cluster-containing hydrogenase component 2